MFTRQIPTNVYKHKSHSIECDYAQLGKQMLQRYLNVLCELMTRMKLLVTNTQQLTRLRHVGRVGLLLEVLVDVIGSWRSRGSPSLGHVSRLYNQHDSHIRHSRFCLLMSERSPKQPDNQFAIFHICRKHTPMFTSNCSATPSSAGIQQRLIEKARAFVCFVLAWP